MTGCTVGGVSYTLVYDAEPVLSGAEGNRLTGVSGAATATFVYDGDGKRVKVTAGGVTTAYVGEHYEWTGSTSTSKKYYYADGARIAMRVGGTLSWLLTDHLGSTAVTANASGTRTGELWYKPWGEYRGTAYGTTPTSYRFTGQREDATIVLYYYGARYYDPVAGRFTQPDTIVPEPDNPDSLNRYAYVLNNPLRYTDPTGHRECEDEECTSWVHPFTGRLFRPLRRFWLATPPTLASIAPGGAFGEGSINWGGQQVPVYQPPSVYAYTDGSYSRGSRCRSQACLDSFTIGDYWWGEDWGNTCVSAFQRQVNPIARGTWEPVHTTTVTAHAFSGRFSTREFFAGIAAGRQFEAESLPPTAEEIGTRAGQVAGAVDALNVIGGALQGLATMTHDDSYYLQRNNAGAYRVIIISVYEAYGGPYYVTAGGRYPVGPILPR